MTVMYLEGTGKYVHEHTSLFTHFVSSDEAACSKAISKKQADFYSIQRTDSISFYHVSYASNKESLEQHGFIMNPEYIGDLGQGVYVVDEEDMDAIINLKDYVESMFEDEGEILLVKGTYSGEFTECVHGDGHVGYLVLKNLNAILIESLETLQVEDFLYDY